jgi:uncharacterized protein (DUF2236 family)
MVGSALRQNLSDATLSLFAHAPYPLEHTLQYEGDPGIAGPGSASWRIIADVAAFVGGLRGLLIQAAHPEVVAGVDHHSRYRDDPLGRLSRTSAYVTATTYGAMPEVEHAARMVRRAHRVVSGVSSRGIAYDASHPSHAAWVHNALTDSFLTANQIYGAYRLSDAEADDFVAEQARIGVLLDADPIPDTASELRAWVSGHPDIASSPEMEDVVDFLTDPPLTPGIKAGYAVLLEAAIVTVPERIRDILGLSPKPGAEGIGRTAVAGLRWALGFSPSWALALQRTGSEIPVGMCRRLPDSQLREAS